MQPAPFLLPAGVDVAGASHDVIADLATAPPAEPALPTYRTVASVLENQNGSGLRLFAWTIARMGLIAPPMLVVGVPLKKALVGAAISSGLISTLTFFRVADARREMVRRRGEFR